MNLVSQPDPSACSDEQHNVEVQDKIDTEQDNETQNVGINQYNTSAPTPRAERDDDQINSDGTLVINNRSASILTTVTEETFIANHQVTTPAVPDCIATNLPFDVNSALPVRIDHPSMRTSGTALPSDEPFEPPPASENERTTHATQVGDGDNKNTFVTATPATKEPALGVEVLMDSDCLKTHEDGDLSTVVLVDKGKGLDPREYGGALYDPKPIIVLADTTSASGSDFNRQTLSPTASDILNDKAIGSTGNYEGRNRSEQEGFVDEATLPNKYAPELQAPLHSDQYESLNNRAFALWTLIEKEDQRVGGDLDEAVTLHRQVLEVLPPTHPDRSMFLDNLANMLRIRVEREGQQDDLYEAVSLHRKALELRPLPHPDRSSSLNNLGLTLLTRFYEGGPEDDLDEAIASHKQALELQHSPHPDRSSFFNNLALALLAKFHEGGQELDDLEEAILSHRQALELRTSPHPNQSKFLNNLAVALRTRFLQGGEGDDLDEAISLHKQGLKLLPPLHPDQSEIRDDLARALLTRFEQEGQQDDLDEAISSYRQALELRPLLHPDRPRSLSGLALALWTQFVQSGQRGDLDEAITLHRQALELLSPTHDQSGYLSKLASALCTRFQEGGQQSDLDEAISLDRQALELLTPLDPYRHPILQNLAASLGIRFELGGHDNDLDEALILYRQAVELIALSDPHRRFSVLNNLANALVNRFEQAGQEDDLDEAISLHKQALELRPPHDPDRSGSLNDLAVALLTRFECGGRRGDLDEAISFYRQALELRASPHSLRSSSLNNLADALLVRFGRLGQRRDLDESISLHRQALELFPPLHSLRYSSLNNLANALLARFTEDGQQEDLDETILLQRQALELLSPSHYDRSGSLNNLANSLRTQFEQGGEQGSIYEAISLFRQALELRAPPHALRHRSLNNLAHALVAQFQKGGGQDNLDEAISLQRQAPELLQPSHPDRSTSFHNLANLLMMAHSHNDSDSDHLAEAMSSFSAAMMCPSQPPSHQSLVATQWAYHADHHYHPSALEAYDAALNILPRVAALSLDIQSRHEALTARSDGLARRAARCAMQEGKLDKAVEYLDAGRAVFWSQLLHIRSPLDELHHHAPELADRLRNIATALEQGFHRNTFAETLDNRKKMTLEEEATILARLDDEWSKKIEEVRRLVGFEDFLRPSNLASLQVAASDGPVVILVGNEDGSDILILTSANVCNISLPGLPTKELQKLVHLVRAASSASQIWRSHFEEIFSADLTEFPVAIRETLRNWLKQEEDRGGRRADKTSSDDIFRLVLKTLWNDVVKPVIDKLSLKKSEEPLVVRWCPTGLFSFLPIHAAGCYDKTIECASDYFISSYTPTLGVLLTQDCPPSTARFKMMAVIQSQELQSTRMELEKIEQHVPSDSLVKFGIPGATATVEAVATKLSDVSIVHFACHGTQDQSNPLDSGLKLEDGWLRVSRIMKEKIPNGALAFLCACETAMGVEKLPDEAMSLGACLLFSGFHRVIATMWEMTDEDGPVIADTFYEELFSGPDGMPTQAPDVKKSVRALHLAVKKLRSKNIPFRRWVPFIHIGK